MDPAPRRAGHGESAAGEHPATAEMGRGALRRHGLLVPAHDPRVDGAPHQQLQSAPPRALETGRFMLRATNTGMTAIIDHHGSIAAALPAFTQGTLNGTAQGRSGATPYVRWGNAPAVVLALLVCGLVTLRRRKPAVPV